MAVLLLLLLLLLPPGVEAFSPPVVLPLEDEPNITIDATGLDTAIGLISQDVVIHNPKGKLYNRQLLRIELTSVLPRKVTWGNKFQARHTMVLPSSTTGNSLMDLWVFEYLSESRMWSFISSTQIQGVEKPK